LREGDRVSRKHPLVEGVLLRRALHVEEIPFIIYSREME
jgi:hypothetical protein